VHIGGRRKIQEIYPPIQQLETDSKETGEFDVGVWMKPRDSKQSYGGDDTYFISKSGKVFGIFDGVGSSFNARQYSYALMSGCKNAAENEGIVDPLKILEYGYESAKVDGGEDGSSTAIIISIDKRFHLLAINLGDCKFIVLRPTNKIHPRQKLNQFSIVEESRELYDPRVTYCAPVPCPLQLNNYVMYETDKPSDGETYEFSLIPDDIIIMASDGFFDNLFEKDIITLINKIFTKSSQTIAKKLVEAAYKKSISKKPTPFSNSLGKKLGLPAGGKQDDITVIVMKIRMTSL